MRGQLSVDLLLGTLVLLALLSVLTAGADLSTLSVLGTGKEIICPIAKTSLANYCAFLRISGYDINIVNTGEIARVVAQCSGGSVSVEVNLQGIVLDCGSEAIP